MRRYQETIAKYELAVEIDRQKRLPSPVERSADSQELPTSEGNTAISAPRVTNSKSKNRCRKPGPKQDFETAARIANVVARVGPNRDWRPSWPEIGEALDAEEIPAPKGWKKRGSQPSSPMTYGTPA
jgi:hypothetical protein